MKKSKIIAANMRTVLFLTSFVLSVFFSVKISAQEEPPIPTTISATGTSLSFGAFTYATTTGTVTVSPDDSRSYTGTLLPLTIGTWSAAIFEVYANMGTMFSILNGSNTTLTRSGGGSMALTIGDSSPESPIITTVPYTDPTYIKVGGTLTVGAFAANPPGDYTGSFEITLVIE